jgi:uncharacterized protein (UPF0333 family)
MEKKDELTPEEYRKKAQEEIQNYKHQWKIFIRTGIVVLAAAIAIIIACIAWFVSNNKVTGSGIGIRSAGSDFELAADAGADGKNSAGVYDKLLEAASGTEETLENKNYITTDGSHTSITWSIVNESNMRNNENHLGIEPGTSGMLRFYIISHKDGALNVTLDLGLTGYTNGTGSTIVKSEETAQKLVKGHVLLFAGYEQGTNSYEGWISEDADPWTMTLDSGSTLTRNADGTLTWVVENAKKDTAYPVQIYWIWPEILGSYLRKDQTATGNRPILFPEEPATGENTSGNPKALPKDLYKKMSQNDKYFIYESKDDQVTADILWQMRNDFNPVIYGEIADCYNLGDQYLGENVRYLKLKLEAL